MSIELKNLQCTKQAVKDDFPHRPLQELELFDHIHGNIIIKPENGSTIHNFGYWNANDACIGQWLTVFTAIKKRIAKGGDFVYEFPYPDQGDPRLEFIFQGETVTTRTTFYRDDSWAEVEEVSEESTPRHGFECLIIEGLQQIEVMVLEASPKTGPAWLDRNRGG